MYIFLLISQYVHVLNLKTCTYSISCIDHNHAIANHTKEGKPLSIILCMCNTIKLHAKIDFNGNYNLLQMLANPMHSE